MNDGHLNAVQLNSWVDGELSLEEHLQVEEHLAECSVCTSAALSQALLKIAAGKAGHRYAMPPHLLAAIQRDITEQTSVPHSLLPALARKSRWRFAALGWVTASILLCASLAGVFYERRAQRVRIASSADATIVAEVFDHHMASLASTEPPQIISTDNHTVKPWFQGKLPFSFNLPDELPGDTILDGANFTYIHGEPGAQLLYRIGKHRVSVFLCARSGSSETAVPPSEWAGFQVAGFHTRDLQGVAISDANPVRLEQLLQAVEHVQTPAN